MKNKLFNKLTVVGLILAVAILAVSCGGSEPVTVTVASKGFAEQFILGEMYALLLEDAGFTVDRKGALGGTPVLHESLLSEDLDVYPE